MFIGFRSYTQKNGAGFRCAINLSIPRIFSQGCSPRSIPQHHCKMVLWMLATHLRKGLAFSYNGVRAPQPSSLEYQGEGGKSDNAVRVR